MAFSEHERAANHAALKWFLARRTPPEHIRAQDDYGYAIVGHTVDLQEIRSASVYRLRMTHVMSLGWTIHVMVRE